MVSLSRKTPCAAQVALQHCPILHMSKRKIMIPTGFHTVNWLNLLRKAGSKPSGQVAQITSDLRLRRTGISNFQRMEFTVRFDNHANLIGILISVVVHQALFCAVKDINETYLYFLWIFSGKPLLPEVKMVK